jgi:hypothetical protein
MIGNVVTFGFGLGAPTAITTLGFGPGPPAPADRTFPTTFRVEIVGTAETVVEPGRTRVVDP